jgi:hypothetical protein
VAPRKTAQAADDPAKFDVDGFISGFKPALVSAKLHHRGDLIPRLNDLLTRIEQLKENGGASERAWSDSDPLTAAVAEYNTLQAEFEAGGFELFQFRPMTGKIDAAVRAAHDKSPHKDQDEYLTWRAMAATCVSHPGIPMEAFPKLVEQVGDVPMGPVIKAFTEAYLGGGVTAPFLPLPLPGPETEAQSPG